MASSPQTFRRAAVSPIEDVSEAWRRIRDEYWLFFGISFVGWLIGSFAPMAILLGPMMCGIYGCYRHHFQGRRVRFEMLFEGFETQVFVQSLLATLVLVGVSLVFTFGLMIVGFVAALALGFSLASKSGQAPPPVMVFAMVILFAVMMTLTIAIGVLFAFLYPLIADRRLKAMEALALSARAALGNLAGLIGLNLVTMGLSLLGVCCCYVGVFFVMPIAFGAHMVAYEKVFGLTPRSEEPQLPRVADDVGKIEP